MTTTHHSGPITCGIAVAGRRVVADCYGVAGPPVVLLHGIPGWRGTWARVAPLLAPAHRVFAPDLLGFGDSDAPPEDGHLDDQAAMVLTLLDRLVIDQAHLVGFDFGGPIAVELYRRAPHRVRSLTLANTNTFTDTPVPGPLKLARVPALGVGLFRLLFGRWGLSLLWWLAVGDKRSFSRRRYVAALRHPQGIRWTRAIMLASMRDLPGRYRAVEETLGQIGVPSLVLWGDRDPFFSLAQGRRTAEAIPGARFVPLPGCGHFAPEERPAALARGIADLVR